MISTRQLIFIISIVFFFVNRATSGNISSSDAPFESLLDGSSNLSSDEEIEEVNIDHLNKCKLELTTPFPKAKPFDNFLHAFLYIYTADFLTTQTYSMAAYEYFKDLLSTAQDLNQPALRNPRNYCIKYQSDQPIEKCLRGIEAVGCPRNDSGVICVKQLYLYWKKDESIAFFYGTIDISDEELADAISRGRNRFPGLSPENLLSSLSDENLLDDYYRENEDKRGKINYLETLRDGCLQNIQEAIDKDRRSPSNITSWNIGVANQNYEQHDQFCKAQRDTDLRWARFNCYGYDRASYTALLNENNRRQVVVPKQLAEAYAMYLYNKITLFGRNMGLDSEERNMFKDPENFCRTFLLYNPHYYN